MKKIAFFSNGEIIYVNHVKTTNKNMYLKVKNFKIFVYVPPTIDEVEMKKFVEKNIPKFLKYINDKKKFRIFDWKEKYVYVFGKKYAIKLELGHSKKTLEFHNDFILFKTNLGSEEEVHKILNKVKKEMTTEYISKKLREVEKEMNSKEHSFSVNNKTSAWGTNIILKNKITFALGLFHYDKEAINYVIYHEVAHSFEANHSKKFWIIVERFCQNYKEMKKLLKSNTSND